MCQRRSEDIWSFKFKGTISAVKLFCIQINDGKWMINKLHSYIEDV